MAFVVNGADWRFDGMSNEEVENRIDDFLGFVEVSREREETVEIGEDFQYRNMLGELTLWEMFGECSDLSVSVEIQQEMAAWLGRTGCYLDRDNWPDGVDAIEIEIGDDAACENADVAWVHHCVRNGMITGCVTLQESCLVDTKTRLGEANLHFVRDEGSRKNFWREAISLDGDNAGSLISYASHAFPNIHFVDGVLGGVNRLSGGYLASRGLVKGALASLDDWGRWVFTSPPPAMTPEECPNANGGGHPSNQLIENRFSGLGLDAAPENPNVKADRVSREARETVLRGCKLYCEWHIKLEPHRNRIHIHAPVPESDEKVVVGMIDEHLPLP